MRLDALRPTAPHALPHGTKAEAGKSQWEGGIFDFFDLRHRTKARVDSRFEQAQTEFG